VFNEIILDTRELEAPEPMTLVLNALCELGENTFIQMIHRMEPMMLYPTLKNNDLNYKVVPKTNQVSIYIWDNSFKDQSKFEDIK